MVESRRLIMSLVSLFTVLLAASFAERTLADDYSLAAARTSGETSQVEVLLEVGGELSLVDDKDKRVRSLKTSVIGTMVYDEKLADSSQSAARGIRQYRRCDAVIKIDKGSSKARLREDRRQIAVAEAKGEVALYSPAGPLSRDELDLIEIPAPSLLVERLLPERRVAPGDQWQHSDELMKELLNLDAVSETKVSTTFKEVTADAAQLELAGAVSGAIDGVATTMDLKGRYKFDLKQQRITWFAILIKEKRAIGHVAPGVDVTARLQMKITPGSTCPELADAALEGVALDPAPGMTLLEYQSADGQFRFLYDRAWHVVSEAPKTVALRLVDRGELIAQCNVSALAEVDPGKRFTLEKFRDDVKQTLGKHFDRFVAASESANSAGHNTCKIVASGEVEQLQVQWNYYLVADAHGHQVVFAYTMEADLVDRFGASDESMLATVTFVPAHEETVAQPTLAPKRK